MRILTDRKEIEESQQEFEKAVSSVAEKQVMQIGDPGGHRKNALVYWVASVDLWANFEKPPRECYWNLLGLGKPVNVAQTICEINLPTRGINRRFAGVYGRCGGNLYILHRGHFNAYRRRIPKGFVCAYFKGTWLFADDGDRDSKVLKVGKVSDSRFLYDLRDFVEAVTGLKERYKNQ